MRRFLLFTLPLLLVWTAVAQSATSLQYVLPGTPVVFGDSAQTPTRVWTLSGLVAANGRVSAQHDKGTGAQPSVWSFVCRMQLTGTLTLRQQIEYYIAIGDGTNVAGEVGTADAPLASSDKRSNLRLIGTLVVDQTTQNVTMTAVFSNISIPERYFSMVAFNATGINFKTDTAVHRCIATPVPPQMQ